MIERNYCYSSIDFLTINNHTVEDIDPVNIVNFMNISYLFISIINLDKSKKYKDIKLIDIYNKNNILKLRDYHIESISNSNFKNIKVFRLKDGDNNFFEIFSTYYVGNNCFLISVNFNNIFDYDENSEKIVNLFPLFFNWMIKNKIKEDIENIITKKEKIILNYVVNGKTNWEIAKILNVSESSIKFHLKNIFKKTHSNNRSHLVSIALKYNVVDFVDFDFDLISIGY